MVACLAAMLEFEACGIEIEEELVDAARSLASDHELPVEFYCASLIPEGGEEFLDRSGHAAHEGIAWLTRDEGLTQDEFGLAAEDFDVIFAYPWPGEDDLILDLFEHFAAVGALLVTFHGGDDIRVRRKLHRGRHSLGRARARRAD